MKRVCVLGCSGAGKTSLATAIAARTGLPHHSLDASYWQPGWTPMAEEDWKRTHRRLIGGGAWVIDGNYFSTLDDRVAAADAIVVLHLPRWRCVWRILRRTACWWGRTRPDMGRDCPERLDPEFLRYVWNFDRDHRPRLLACLAARPELRVIHIRNERDRAAFLAAL
jgi:adenylate kinase family enzyme